MKRFIVLTCEALARSIYSIAAETPHIVSVRLFKQGLHDRPKNLREVLQEHIDAVGSGECDAILLAYGMCGRSTVGLTSTHTPLVIPRAHDCITLYLGSHRRYQEEFERHPGTYWYSVDYLERREPGASSGLGAAGIEDQDAQYEKYVQKYGKAAADMLMDEMRKWARHYTRAVFVDTGHGDGEQFAALAREKAHEEGWLYERIMGNRRLLEMLLHGNWPNEEILVVPPGHAISQSYCDEVMRSTPV